MANTDRFMFNNLLAEAKKKIPNWKDKFHRTGVPLKSFKCKDIPWLDLTNEEWSEYADIITTAFMDDEDFVENCGKGPLLPLTVADTGSLGNIALMSRVHPKSEEDCEEARQWLRENPRRKWPKGFSLRAMRKLNQMNMNPQCYQSR